MPSCPHQMHPATPRLLVFSLVYLTCSSTASAGKLPLMGWSSWNLFGCNVNETLILATANAMAGSNLTTLGYSWVLLDDCWTRCALYGPKRRCLLPGARDSQSRLVADPDRFPNGIAHLASRIQGLGLRFGIYTSVSAATCAGFTGSLGFEAIDAETFASWGVDFVKHDTCGVDCPVHNGCIRNATHRMSKALKEASAKRNKSIVYYLDHGNPSNAQRAWNPDNVHVVNEESLAKVATRTDELVWTWAPMYVDMYKSAFDRSDTWTSLLVTAHNQAKSGPYQKCGAIHSADALTVGMGRMSTSEYRTEMTIYAVLATPLILSLDLTTMDSSLMDIVGNPEVIAVNQDPLCLQGSLVRAENATETWVKTCQDGDFVVAVINKGAEAQDVYVRIDGNFDSDFFPATINSVRVRDLWKRENLGHREGLWRISGLGPHQARMFRVTPVV